MSKKLPYEGPVLRVIESDHKHAHGELWNKSFEGVGTDSRWFFTDDEGNDYDLLNTITEWKQLRALIAIARCPNEGCVDGAIPVQVGDDDWEAQQCQWCYERAAILYGDGK